MKQSGTQLEELERQFRTRITRLYEGGNTIRGVALITGCSYGYVHMILTDAGVTIRSRGRTPGSAGPRNKLIAERNKLLARIKEINALLAKREIDAVLDVEAGLP